MNVLILGASGLVGGNCLRHFRSQGWNCVGTHFSFPTPETHFYNTQDPDDPANFDVGQFSPDVIVHCGALTHVDYCEDHVDESYEKTVRSTHMAVALARKFDSLLVFLSTDYVFDGMKGWYREDDEVHPLSVYAHHKLEAERFVASELDRYLVARITNVYGDEVRGKNFISRLAENMRKGEPMELRLPVDQYATPVNAADVARALYLLISHHRHGVYHFASTDMLNRVQLAERVAQYFGHDGVKIVPMPTSDLHQPARRPLRGGLSAEKFNAEFSDFRWTNVDDYLTKLHNRYSHE